MADSSTIKPLFINRSEFGGGAEQFTRDLVAHTPEAHWIVEDGHAADMATPLPPTWRTRLSGIADKALRKTTRFRGVHQLSGWLDSGHQTLKRLQKTSAYPSANLIHLNNIHGGWFDLSALEAIDSEKPVVWTLHDMWCMTGGEAYVFDDTGYQRGEWNTPHFANYPLNAPLFDRRKYYLAQKKARYPHLGQTVFVPVSDWLADCLRKSFVWHEKMRITVIKNGVDTDRFQPTHPQRESGKKKVLFFNNPSPFKGADIGLEVLSAVGDRAEILVVGEPPSTLPSSDYRGKHVSSRDALRALYNEADLLLFPSKAENMPLTVLEAMSCGTPAVAARIGGIPEIVLPRETGFLADAPEASLLTAQLEAAIDSDLSAYSRRARDFVCTHHSFRNMVDQYRALYTSLMG